MALRAGVLQQILIGQRTLQIVAGIHIAVLGDNRTHVAVRTGEHALMYAAFAEIGLELGVVDHDLTDAGILLHIVGKDLPVDDQVVVILQHGVGAHGGEIGVGESNSLGGGIEVVIDMALTAGQILGIDTAEVLTESVGQIGMRDSDLAGGVGVAVVAAEHFVGLGEDIVLEILKGHGVDFDALLVYRIGEHRGFAGEAVGHFVGTARARDVFHNIGVSTGAAVAFGKAVALEQRLDHRIIPDIILNLIIFTVGSIGCVDFRIFFLPLGGGDERGTGVCLDKVGCLFSLDAAVHHQLDGFRDNDIGLGGDMRRTDQHNQQYADHHTEDTDNQPVSVSLLRSHNCTSLKILHGIYYFHFRYNLTIARRHCQPHFVKLHDY